MQCRVRVTGACARARARGRHIYCEGCLHRWLQRERTCPVRARPTYKYFDNILDHIFISRWLRRERARPVRIGVRPHYSQGC